MVRARADRYTVRFVFQYLSAVVRRIQRFRMTLRDGLVNVCQQRGESGCRPVGQRVGSAERKLCDQQSVRPWSLRRPWRPPVRRRRHAARSTDRSADLLAVLGADLAQQVRDRAVAVDDAVAAVGVEQFADGLGAALAAEGEALGELAEQVPALVGVVAR